MKRQSLAKTAQNGVLGATIMLVLVSVAFLGCGPRGISHGDYRLNRARSFLSASGRMLEMFRVDTGRYPRSEEGLDALVHQPDRVENWHGPYSSEAVQPDPWGHPYRYEQFLSSEGPGYSITCFGEDGLEGGMGLSEDIVEMSGEAPNSSS